MKYEFISVGFPCVAIQLLLVKTKPDTKLNQQLFSQEKGKAIPK